MKPTASNASTKRPLLIDFDQFTDGDEVFRQELIVLMIDNVQELRSELRQANQRNDHKIFHNACHKMKPTLSMLNDNDLTNAIDQLNHTSVDLKVERQGYSATFDKICEEIIKSLENELT